MVQMVENQQQDENRKSRHVRRYLKPSTLLPLLDPLFHNDEFLLMAGRSCAAHNGFLVNWPFDSEAHPLVANWGLINEVLLLLSLPLCLIFLELMEVGCLLSRALNQRQSTL